MKTKSGLLCGFAVLFSLTLAPGTVWAQRVPSGLEWKVDGSSVTITRYRGTAASVSIPDRIDGKPVTRLGERAFASCTSLKSVAIAPGITKIGRDVFFGCTNLTRVTLSRRTRVAADAFPDTVRLTYRD